MKISQDPSQPQATTSRLGPIPRYGTTQNPYNNAPLPIQARRQTKPTLADRHDAGNEGPLDHNNSPENYDGNSQYSQESPELHHSNHFDNSNYQNHNPSGKPSNAQQAAGHGYAPPYNQKRQRYSQTQHSGKQPLIHPNQQGPYQAVVVFLLLLMALVIMVVVYHLFFRPRQVGIPFAEKSEYSNVTEQPNFGPTPPQSEGAQGQDAGNHSFEGLLGKSVTAGLPLASPVSSMTSSGEAIPQSTIAPPSSSPILTKPDSPVDESELLLQSKVGGVGYWIQVGAFSSFNNANNVKKRLAQNQLESIIQEGKSKTGKIYRVRIGLYASKEETERILRQLKSIHTSFANSIIIKVEI